MLRFIQRLRRPHLASGLCTCLLLVACQSTSLREYSAVNDTPIHSALAQEEPEHSAHYSSPKANQLRMYIFTEHDNKHEPQRQGYFIDFEVNSPTDQP